MMPNDTITLISLLFFLIFVTFLMGDISATMFTANPQNIKLCPDLYTELTENKNIEVKNLPSLKDMTNEELEEHYGWASNASLTSNLKEQIWSFFFEFGYPLKLLTTAERTLLYEIPLLGDVLRITTNIGSGLNAVYKYFTSTLSLMLSPCSDMRIINILVIFPVIMGVIVYLIKSLIPFTGG